MLFRSTCTAVAPMPVTVLLTLLPPVRLKVTTVLAPDSAATVTTPPEAVASALVAPLPTPAPDASVGAAGATLLFGAVSFLALREYITLVATRRNADFTGVRVDGRAHDGQHVADTECTTEMKALKNIDIAFLPMNLPYTMPPNEAAECAKAFKPKVLYPYHYGDSNISGVQGMVGKDI